MRNDLRPTSKACTVEVWLRRLIVIMNTRFELNPEAARLRIVNITWITESGFRVEPNIGERQRHK